MSEVDRRMDVIERAARALHGWESSKDSVPWEREDEYARESVREAVGVVLDAANYRGAVEAERAEIVTLLQEAADTEPRMSEARLALLAAAKRIHPRGQYVEDEPRLADDTSIEGADDLPFDAKAGS